MSVVDRATALLPTLPKRTVDCPEIGGEVIVRGLMLADRLPLLDEAVGSPDGVPLERVPRVLAATVIGTDGEPLWTEEQWNQFGAVHTSAAVKLFNVAMELSGFAVTTEGDPEKNA